MQTALMSFTLFCLLSSSVTAAATPSWKFSLDNQEPEDPNQQAAEPVSAGSQAPATMPRATVVQPAPLSGSEKFHFYLKSTYGPAALAFSLAGSGVNQARGTVPEWGQGMTGYGKRFASGYTQKVVNNSISQSMAAALHEDPRYFASNRTGIWDRTLYAVGQSFVAHKDSGGTRPAYSRFVGAFSAAYVSRQWLPDTYHNASDYLSAGVISIGLGMAKNVFFEFWPNVRRMLHH